MKIKPNYTIIGIVAIVIILTIIAVAAFTNVPSTAGQISKTKIGPVAGLEINSITLKDTKTSTVYDGIKVCFNLKNAGTTAWTGLVEAQLTKIGSLSISSSTTHCDASNPTDGKIEFTILPGKTESGCIEFPKNTIGSGTFEIRLFTFDHCCVGPTGNSDCQPIGPVASWSGEMVGYGEVTTSTCTANAYSRCWTDTMWGDAYYYNSCDAKGNIKSNCPTGDGVRAVCINSGSGTGRIATCRTCTDECAEGTGPTCSGDNKITCILSSATNCYKKVTTGCEYGCADGACKPEPKKFCTTTTRTCNAENGCSGTQTCDEDNDVWSDCQTDKNKCGDGTCKTDCGACTNDATQDCTADNTCPGSQTCSGSNWGVCVSTLQLCEDGTCQATCDNPGLDEDLDGVDDTMDLCPATPAGATVDAQGCDSTQSFMLWLDTNKWYVIVGALGIGIVIGLVVYFGKKGKR
jgi:hypothetical protein